MFISGGKGSFIFAITPWPDKRLKTNIKDTNINGLNIINSIKLREFDFKDPKYGNHQDIGYIAQELKDIVPECTPLIPQSLEDSEHDQLYYVNDTHLIKYLVKAVQELSKEIEELKKK